MADVEPAGATPDGTPPEGNPAEDAPTETVPTGPAPARQRPAGVSTRPNPRKVREGTVVSDAMDKTAVVRVVQRVRHRRYGKTVQRTSKLYAHDPANEAKVGDRVQVAECRPLSRMKRWRVVQVLERAR